MNDDLGSADVGQAAFKPLRGWPAALFVVAMIVARWLPSLIEDGPPNLWMSAAFGPLLCSILIMLWWLIASRASARERMVGFVACAAGVGLTAATADKSMVGPVMMVVTVPIGMALFALGLVLLGRTLSFKRTVIASLLAVFGFGHSTLLRNDGMWGDFAPGLHWRWTPSPEQQLLANIEQSPRDNVTGVVADDLEEQLAGAEWPGFRGSDRTGRQHGVVFTDNWEEHPPKEIWKILVGPGWSSFSVAGNLLFTQEQRGPQEAVVCYEAETGEEVWVQHVDARFDEAIGGPGPRATPTITTSGIFAMGAEGHLLRLDARTGDIIWRKDLREIAERDPPVWGFSSSPLVVGQVAIVHAGGSGDKGILAFDIESGDLTWSAAAGGHSYSSPHPCEIGGESLVLVATDAGVNVVDPASGAERLNYGWKHQGYRALQPQVIGNDAVVIPTGMGTGTRLIRIAKQGDDLQSSEVWTSRHLKPDYNDLVVYQDHGYRFDGLIFTCIDLQTGERKWKGGRYGKGQVLLLEDSGLLLVASEKGELVLLRADPSAHIELARTQAIEGKTWNHPVVVGDRVYVRNGQEAACYQLPTVLSE